MSKLILAFCAACLMIIAIAEKTVAQQEKFVWIFVTDTRGRGLPNISVSTVDWEKPENTTMSGTARIAIPTAAQIGDLIQLVIRSKSYTSATGQTIDIRIPAINRRDQPVPITLVRKISPLVGKPARDKTRNSVLGKEDPFQRGKRAFAAQRFSEALEHFLKAYRIRQEAYQTHREKKTASEFAEVNAELGATLFILNKLGEALDKLEEAVRLNPGDDESKAFLGLCAFIIGDHFKAEQVFREIMSSRKKPRFFPGWARLMVSGIYEHYGKLDEAARLREVDSQALSLEPRSKKRASGLREMNDLNRAITDALRDEDYPSSAVGIIRTSSIILCKEALAFAERTYGAYDPLVAAGLKSLVLVLYEVGREAEAEKFLERSISIDKRVYGHDSIFQVFTLCKIAEIRTESRKYDEAERDYAEAAAIIEKVLSKDHSLIALVHRGLAELYTKKAKYKLAESRWQILKRMHCLSESADNLQCINALSGLAELYSVQKRYADAIPPLREALGIAKKLWAAKDSRGTEAILEMIDNLLYLSRQVNDTSGIEAFQKERERISEFLAPPKGGPEETGSSTTTATAIRVNGVRCADVPGNEFTQYDKAKRLLEAAVRAAQSLRPGDPDLIEARSKLAFIYSTESRYGEAATVVKQALESNESALHENRYVTASLLTLLAGINHDRGNFAEAERICKRAVDLFEILLGESHQNVASILYSLARIQRAQNRYTEAEKNLERALKIRESVEEDESLCIVPDSVTILAELGILYVQMQRYNDADRVFQQALSAIGYCCLDSYAGSGYILANYAECLRKMGNEHEAVQMERRASKIKAKK